MVVTGMSLIRTAHGAIVEWQGAYMPKGTRYPKNAAAILGDVQGRKIIFHES